MVSLSKIYLLRIILKLRKKVCRRLYSNMFALVILSPFTVFAQDISSSQTIIPAHDVSTLYQALQTANANGQTDIQLSPGIYRLTSTLVISAPSIRLIGDSTDPSLIRFVGRGMRSLSQVENLITVRAKHFSLDGITLTDAGNHLIQILSLIHI